MMLLWFFGSEGAEFRVLVLLVVLVILVMGAVIGGRADD